MTQRRKRSRTRWRKQQERKPWKNPVAPGVRGKAQGGNDSPRPAPPPRHPEILPEKHESPGPKPRARRVVEMAPATEKAAPTYAAPPKVPRIPDGGSGFFGTTRAPVAPSAPVRAPRTCNAGDVVEGTTEEPVRQEVLCPMSLEPCWGGYCELWNHVTADCHFRSQTSYLSQILGRLAGSRSSFGTDLSAPEEGSDPSRSD